LKLSTHVPNIPFEGGRTIQNFKGHIEFQNVSFKYPTRDIYVLKNVSFEIAPGQTGALVGHSGSGKSTCVQLLERFYEVTDGFILLDGVDIRELDPRWLHSQISLVSQEPTLFEKSIKENILYGVDEETTSEEELNHAIETANCRKFISKLTEGIETNVGEKGASLSGGQQRVALPEL
jgi:ABC-type multidrug transport system fused ATPase/permease subunit